jgi:hypothetical protein
VAFVAIVAEHAMSEGFAFRVFVAIVSGGLAVLTIAMIAIAVVLFRGNRRKR